jgi:hypothetical protein
VGDRIVELTRDPCSFPGDGGARPDERLLVAGAHGPPEHERDRPEGGREDRVAR